MKYRYRVVYYQGGEWNEVYRRGGVDLTAERAAELCGDLRDHDVPDHGHITIQRKSVGSPKWEDCP